ncbi:hypothetical protein J6G99_02285 [bacterium]|nr:hypothetical protein [bacterium]
MKKIGISLALLMFTSSNAFAVNPTYIAPNAGNMDFYPMMQTQIEKQETLDFKKDPEQYKEKRKKKNSKNELIDTKFNPNYVPNFNGTYLHPTYPAPMKFIKDENGNIKIQEIQSYSEKNINTDK